MEISFISHSQHQSGDNLEEDLTMDQTFINWLLGGFGALIGFLLNAGVSFDDNNGAGYPILTYVIAADAISIGYASPVIIIDTEAAASTDDLSIISGGYVGQQVTIRSASVSRVVTIKDNIGNIQLAGSDMALNSATDTLTLVYTGTTWSEIARSNNA